MALVLSDLVYIDATGYHFADYPSFLQWRTEQYQAIYGSDVYIAPSSQDGQNLAITAKADYDTAALGASIYNSFAPPTAQGVGLARLVKINGLTKESASFSTVTLTIVGTGGTVITNGIAADSLQQQWLLPASVTIPGGGTINVTATAAVKGAVFADIATITTIFTPTRGWQTVNNASAATPGAPVESDAELRARQAVSTGLPASTPLESTVARVANVPGVVSVEGYENALGTTQGVTNIPAHSISIVYSGSADPVAVCQAIQVAKTPGTRTYSPSNTYETVADKHGMLLNIFYQIAIAASIQVTVTVSTLAGWSTDFEALIQAAVAAAVNSIGVGGAGNTGVGGFVYLSSLFTAASLSGTPQASTFFITGIIVGKNGGSQTAINQPIAWDEIPVCSADTDVTVDT